jgi:hypothetical protein
MTRLRLQICNPCGRHTCRSPALGGVVAPLFINRLAGRLGWRHALGFVGALILLVLSHSESGSRGAPEELALGLYAHPARDCRMFWYCFARKVIGTHYQGIFHWSMDGSLDWRQNL